ncbi:hypothetical protein HCU40_15590 [Pseudanabaena biceps]|nr:hypothetical protein [Pseudanabaena biceps]
MNVFHNKFRNQLRTNFQKASLYFLTVTCSAIPLIPSLEASASTFKTSSVSSQVTSKVAQLSQDWQTGVRLLRLLDNSGNLSSIGILLDIANKPSTTYANAVYQLYVRRGGEWREVYTNSGARLLSKNAGRFTAPVEVIPLSLLSEKISLDDIYNGDIKAITSVRYDLPNGTKDVKFETEEVRSFSSIVAINSSEVTSGRINSVYTSNPPNNYPSNPANSYPSYPANSYPNNSSNNSEPSDRDLGISTGSQSSNIQSNQTVVVQTTNVQSNSNIKPIAISKKSDYNDDEYDDDDYEDENGRRISKQRDRANSDNGRTPDGVELSRKNPHRGHFSLAILQNQPRLSQVIARISLKSKRSKGFLTERFVGDYRFAINQRATFISGLNPGDRLVVRLFDLQNRPLGYSEVQLLKDFATINLILPSDPSAYGTLRTVSGIDSQHIGTIDRNVKIYDYFTTIQTSSVISQTVARFLTNSQGVPINLFNVAGLPQAPSQFNYTNAFIKGNQSLINRTINVFTPDMPPVMQVLPGQLTSVIGVSNSQSFNVVKQILNYKDLRPTGLSTLF